MSLFRPTALSPDSGGEAPPPPSCPPPRPRHWWCHRTNGGGPSCLRGRGGSRGWHWGPLGGSLWGTGGAGDGWELCLSPSRGGLRTTPSPASVSPVGMEGGGRPRVGGSGVTAWRWPRPAVRGQASAAPVLSRADGDRGGRRRPCLPRIKCTVPAGAGPGGPPPCPCPCHAGTPAAVSPGDGDPGVPGGPGGAVGTQGLGLSRTPGEGDTTGTGVGGCRGDHRATHHQPRVSLCPQRKGSPSPGYLHSLGTPTPGYPPPPTPRVALSPGCPHPPSSHCLPGTPLSPGCHRTAGAARGGAGHRGGG